MPTISEAQLEELREEIAQMSRSQARIALRMVIEALAHDHPTSFHDYHRFIEWAFQLAA